MGMNKDDELLANRVNDFLSSNKKIILSLVGILVAIIVSLTVYFSLLTKRQADNIASVERIVFDLNKAKENIEKEKEEEKKKLDEKDKDESGNAVVEISTASEKVEKMEQMTSEKEIELEEKDDDDDDAERLDIRILEQEDEAIQKLEELTTNTSGYASYLAFYNIADIYFARREYAKAKDYYAKAVETVPNSYVLGVLFFNMAVCMEELSEDDGDVLLYYKKAAEIENFPLKPRAMFNMARMQEKMGKIDMALETYKDILKKYPDNDFAFIGKTRMIQLEIKK